MDQVEESVSAPLRAFFKDSYRLVKRCNKPDRKGASVGRGDARGRAQKAREGGAVRLVSAPLCFPFASPLHAPPPPPNTTTTTTEFTQITLKTAMGFLIMGFIGFFVKLLFIVSRDGRRCRCRCRRCCRSRAPSRPVELSAPTHPLSLSLSFCRHLDLIPLDPIQT